MSDKTREAKQAKQAAASWTAPTSVLYDRVLSPMYDEVARFVLPKAAEEGDFSKDALLERGGEEVVDEEEEQDGWL